MFSGRRVAKKGGHPALSPTVQHQRCLLPSLPTSETQHRMFARELAGSIPINGRSRELRVQANPVGRTVIQVDGVTVYNKRPIV